MNTRIMGRLEYDGTAAPRSTGDEWVLVQRAIAGDARAFDLLIDPMLGGLKGVAYAMLHNREDAEDALQDGLCKAFCGLRSFQGRSSFSTWLTRIVINSALMTLRRQRRKRNHLEYSLDDIEDNQQGWLAHSAVDERPNPERICAFIEMSALIKEQIMRLPASERTAFLYYVVNGHSVTESSLMSGIPAATLKSRILRTRRKLAHGLQRSIGKACAQPAKEQSAYAAQC
ncbi:MAG: sigma-70 family RNA polymerase sigma factor [Terracidiphilus sp.]